MCRHGRGAGWPALRTVPSSDAVSTARPALAKQPYETEAEGCDPALESSACTIIYRTFEFAALAAKTDDSQVQQSLTNSRADPMQTSARELQRRIDEAVTAGAPSLSVAGGEYNVRPAPSSHATW